MSEDHPNNRVPSLLGAQTPPAISKAAIVFVMRKFKLRQVDVARKLEVSESFISRVINETESLSMAKLSTLAQRVEMPLQTLLVKAAQDSGVCKWREYFETSVGKEMLKRADRRAQLHKDSRNYERTLNWARKLFEKALQSSQSRSERNTLLRMVKLAEEAPTSILSATDLMRLLVSEFIRLRSASNTDE